MGKRDDYSFVQELLYQYDIYDAFGNCIKDIPHDQALKEIISRPHIDQLIHKAALLAVLDKREQEIIETLPRTPASEMEKYKSKYKAYEYNYSDSNDEDDLSELETLKNKNQND